jgi:cyclophilin family peptidyl-prolyl cis-trans isomerase
MTTASALRGVFVVSPHPRRPGLAARRTRVCRHGSHVVHASLLRSSPELPGDVRWEATLGSKDVRIAIPLPSNTDRGDITVKIQPDKLTVTLNGVDVLDGDLPSPVNLDGSYWEKEDGTLFVVLEKQRLAPAWEFLLETDLPPPGDTTVTKTVFFDIDINGESAGRITFGLFGKHVPKTTENFRALCCGDFLAKTKHDAPLRFKDSCFHRIVPGVALTGGDFTKANGKGGVSIYGDTFADEAFGISHDEPFLLSMANAGPDTNGSQFLITTAPAPRLDNKHVVFGKVLSGFDVVRKMEAFGTPEGKPRAQVAIAECGELGDGETETAAAETETARGVVVP